MEDIKAFFGEKRDGWGETWLEKYNNYLEVK